MARPFARVLGLPGVLIVSLVGCSGEAAAPVTTSEFYFPPDSAASTLLPVIPETLPPVESLPVPPDALFGGDLCDALDTAEVAVERVEYLALDTCLFTLASGDLVRVEAMSASDFLERPADALSEDLTGWPDTAETAWSAAVFGGFRVLVRVPNGWFGVTAPTLAVARRSARSATQWVLGGAPTEVDLNPIDDTVPADATSSVADTTATPKDGTAPFETAVAVTATT